MSQTPNSGEITKTFTARSLGRGYGKVVSSVGGMSASHMPLATPKKDLAVPARGELLRHVVCSDRGEVKIHKGPG